MTFYISLMKKLLRQHNAITEARYEMSALEKNIVYMLINLLSDALESTKYTMNITQLERLKDTQIKGQELSQAARQLVKRTLMIHDSATKKYIGLKLVSSAKYLRGQLTLEVDKVVLPFFFQLKKNFTTLDLKVALKLRSVYSKRIYEMLCQYKDTGVLHISLQELKARLGLISLDTSIEKYAEFAPFKKFVLEVAQKELSQKADLTFSYKAIKTGKKYTQLHFYIKKTSQLNSQGLEVEQGVKIEDKDSRGNTFAFKQLVGKYKLSPWQADKVLKGVPLDEIRETTYAIQLELRNNRINNIGGYTAKVFEQKYGKELFREQ